MLFTNIKKNRPGCGTAAAAAVVTSSWHIPVLAFNLLCVILPQPLPLVSATGQQAVISFISCCMNHASLLLLLYPIRWHQQNNGRNNPCAVFTLNLTPTDCCPYFTTFVLHMIPIETIPKSTEMGAFVLRGRTPTFTQV